MISYLLVAAQILCALLFGLAVTADVVSLIWELRANRRGYGPSRIPVVPLIVYIAVGLLCWKSWAAKITWMIAATLFHLTVQYFIPIWDRDTYYKKSGLPRCRNQ